MKKAFIYITLWFAGALVAGAILLLKSKADGNEQVIIFEGMNEGLKIEGADNNIVNELMLSANELNIYGNSTLIQYNNIYGLESPSELIEQLKSNPANAYKAILKSKMEKIKKRSTLPEDFYIKPVPK